MWCKSGHGSESGVYTRGHDAPSLGERERFPPFLKLTNTEPFAAWFIVTGDVTPDGIRVVRSVLGAISSLPIVAFRE